MKTNPEKRFSNPGKQKTNPEPDKTNVSFHKTSQQLLRIRSCSDNFNPSFVEFTTRKVIFTQRLLRLKLVCIR